MNLCKRGLVVIVVAVSLCAAFVPSAVAQENVVERVVYHVDDSSNAGWAMLLARAHLGQNPKARLVIVGHGPGVDFLLQDAADPRGNPYEVSVQDLMDQGVEFRICEATLSVRNISPDRVLEGVAKVPSGAYEIARLQSHEGYVYLKP